jgi:hypothetical protein
VLAPCHGRPCAVHNVDSRSTPVSIISNTRSFAARRHVRNPWVASACAEGMGSWGMGMVIAFEHAGVRMIWPLIWFCYEASALIVLTK